MYIFKYEKASLTAFPLLCIEGIAILKSPAVHHISPHVAAEFFLPQLPHIQKLWFSEMFLVENHNNFLRMLIRMPVNGDSSLVQPKFN
ncbi:hypothetical protein HNQ59_000023 [Chitinivorax tropicus]|uniref:Uncharacterized protein n=1 Tax=Chitinivorax tropicus TaxID=714531 RepID=A0A840MNE3_9PROT|nr:hypothetical protein [Chitinivorax tropicus]